MSNEKNSVKIKTEPEDIINDDFVFKESEAWLDLPIPFKEELDSAEERSTEIYLDEVSAAVNANIAQIGEDLVETSNKHLNDVKIQMEALQRTLMGEKLRDRRFKINPREKKTKEVSKNTITYNEKTNNVHIDPANDENSSLDCDDDDLPKCIVCRRVFNDEAGLEEHINNRTPGVNLGCCGCNKVFRDNSQLNIHFRTHTGEKPFECKECDKKFSIKGNLNKHMRVHTGERRFECKTCSKRFIQFAHLDDHIKTHTGERPFNCEECHSAFKTKALLKKHKKNHDEHLVRKRCVRCPICDKVMKTSKQLYGHMKLHCQEDEPFKCEVCGKNYKTLFYLQSHQKMHEGIKPYKCSVCEKAFVASSQLRRHENSHAGFKPYHCEICFKSFGVYQNLKRHILTHTGDRPFSCVTCGKSFLTYENMNRHTRTHTGEKPFSCDICGRKFAHSTTVKEHRRTHTGDKPYGCSICNKRFSLNKVLYRHMRMRHPELHETFEKVNDIPKQVRLQVAHNFDKDEYQKPDYINCSDILNGEVKFEGSENEDEKPLKYINSKAMDSLKNSYVPKYVAPENIKSENAIEEAKAQIGNVEVCMDSVKKENDWDTQ
ncbi:hypothetical protein HHI36_010638 [Cryptolaemus montrouzieri]|uniref:C2H2-type domain-containing protein n=1 Tax=Cryptolaemus montrouzieri TaxID=559131 RepID=A0ABD2MJC4_9CUCU